MSELEQIVPEIKICKEAVQMIDKLIEVLNKLKDGGLVEESKLRSYQYTLEEIKKHISMQIGMKILGGSK